VKNDPASQYGFTFQTVSFDATDGTHLSGWWIPARGPAHSSGGFERGTRTVLVCHGWGANKAKQLTMARFFVPGGYNVLAMDFRGHGESAGQLTTFGDVERRDVLGAVRWIRSIHPEQAHRLFGIGADT